MTPDRAFSVLDRALAARGPDSSDFDLNPDVTLAPGRVLRPAGVLIAVDVTRADPQVILTKRSARLKHHPGQVAFPGGKQDPGDPTTTHAALREAEEEIGLPRGNVRVLGNLPGHETVTGFAITPVVGLIERPFALRPEPGEVEEVFRVPLSYLLDPQSYRIEGRRWQGRRRHYYVVPWGAHYIWGATARMLRGLAERAAR